MIGASLVFKPLPVGIHSEHTCTEIGPLGMLTVRGVVFREGTNARAEWEYTTRDGYGGAGARVKFSTALPDEIREPLIPMVLRAMAEEHGSRARERPITIAKSWSRRRERQPLECALEALEMAERSLASLRKKVGGGAAEFEARHAYDAVVTAMDAVKAAKGRAA